MSSALITLLLFMQTTIQFILYDGDVPVEKLHALLASAPLDHKLIFLPNPQRESEIPELLARMREETIKLDLDLAKHEHGTQKDQHREDTRQENGKQTFNIDLETMD